MTFEEWKCLMFREGHLSHAQRKRYDANMYPYACLGPLTSKFANHIKKCYNEGLENQLSIEDWLFVCYTSGIMHPDDIGIAMNKHHLSRIGDVGGYSINTCRYILGRDNMRERDANGGTKRGSIARSGSGNGMYGNTKYTGTNGALWCGYYHTPKGRFDTAQQAAEANGISKASINRYCKHTSRCKDMSEQDRTNFVDNLIKKDGGLRR
ncbi:hypothetical protein VPDG_00028 [Vibrio phage henriette 12B8]|uniref:hypothetical protein n=1 Tax=Vibrio phage henriette 12B8 TaxID=573174 RepID=UPI0002C13F49|nr:hypothetical protein VPDG_00028 [Vibrio phage henriette 12B8]AGG58189.1 hypothetical protein VPDG_00028 [Vibrio phage henriette 12B8]